MPDLNVPEIVRIVSDAVNRRDFDALDRSGVMHPELEFHSIVARVEGAIYRRMDGLRAWSEMADDIWEDFRIEVLDVRVGTEDRALVHLLLTGTARGSGVPLDVPVSQAWHWHDGLLRRNVAYSDPDEAARAAGL